MNLWHSCDNILAINRVWYATERTKMYSSFEWQAPTNISRKHTHITCKILRLFYLDITTIRHGWTKRTHFFRRAKSPEQTSKTHSKRNMVFVNKLILRISAECIIRFSNFPFISFCCSLFLFQTWHQYLYICFFFASSSSPPRQIVQIQFGSCKIRAYFEHIYQVSSTLTSFYNMMIWFLLCILLCAEHIFELIVNYES